MLTSCLAGRGYLFSLEMVMPNIDPANAAEWTALFTIAATLGVASISGFWAVWVRSQENTRAEWRRLEELFQTVQHGSAKGLWAQKIAVDELITLKRRRHEIKRTLEQASMHFRNTVPMGVELADHIDSALTRL